jgi:hypothetical protein
MMVIIERLASTARRNFPLAQGPDCSKLLTLANKIGPASVMLTQLYLVPPRFI